MRFDSSAADAPGAHQRVHGKLLARAHEQAVADVEQVDRDRFMRAVGAHARGGFGSGFEQRIDFAMGAVHREFLQRTGGGKQEQQQRALGERADGTCADCHRQHEKMNVDFALRQFLADVAERIPTAGQHREAIEHRRQPGQAGRKPSRRIRQQGKHGAAGGQERELTPLGQLRFSGFLAFRPFEFAPGPEARCRHTTIALQCRPRAPTVGHHRKPRGSAGCLEPAGHQVGPVQVHDGGELLAQAFQVHGPHRGDRRLATGGVETDGLHALFTQEESGQALGPVRRRFLGLGDGGGHAREMVTENGRFFECEP